MTEGTESGLSVRRNSRLDGLSARGLFWSAGLILCGALAGFAFRGYVDYQDLIDSEQRVVQFRSENRQLKSQIDNQESKLNALQAKLSSVQSELDAIMPSANTYIIKPNQSMIVAGGHLTIGLIGSPTNENINININGKQQSAVTGDVINIAADPSTKCHVTVQSFDMFNALLTASCMEPQ